MFYQFINIDFRLYGIHLQGNFVRKSVNQNACAINLSDNFIQSFTQFGMKLLNVLLEFGFRYCRTEMGVFADLMNQQFGTATDSPQRCIQIMGDPLEYQRHRNGLIKIDYIQQFVLIDGSGRGLCKSFLLSNLTLEFFTDISENPVKPCHVALGVAHRFGCQLDQGRAAVFLFPIKNTFFGFPPVAQNGEQRIVIIRICIQVIHRYANQARLVIVFKDFGCRMVGKYDLAQCINNNDAILQRLDDFFKLIANFLKSNCHDRNKEPIITRSTKL